MTAQQWLMHTFYFLSLSALILLALAALFKRQIWLSVLEATLLLGVCVSAMALYEAPPRAPVVGLVSCASLLCISAWRRWRRLEAQRREAAQAAVQAAAAATGAASVALDAARLATDTAATGACPESMQAAAEAHQAATEAVIGAARATQAAEQVAQAASLPLPEEAASSAPSTTEDPANAAHHP